MRSTARYSLEALARYSGSVSRRIVGGVLAMALASSALPAAASSALPNKLQFSEAGAEALMQRRMAEQPLAQPESIPIELPKRRGTKLRYTRPLQLAGNDMLLKVRLPGKGKTILSFELKF